jgi:hypothetical protein
MAGGGRARGRATTRLRKTTIRELKDTVNTLQLKDTVDALQLPG